MGRIGATLPGFCLNRIRPLVRIRSPIVHFKTQSESAKSNDEITDSHGSFDDDRKEQKASIEVNIDVNVKPSSPVTNVVGRKIMVVVDSSAEAKNALHWALTHTVQSHDVLILLYVSKISNPGDESNKEMNPRVSQFLSCMKILCQQKRPEVTVEVSVAHGKEKGATIVEEAKKQEVALLVLGQKKRFNMTWRLVMMWATGNNKIAAGGGGVVEYCIKNATCLAIGVRRKNKKVGGYLITTKRQKDFWLLA